jgi:hypothetical protein
VDPMTVLTAAGAGLGLVDRFYDLVKKVRGEPVTEHSVRVDATNDRLIVTAYGRQQEYSANDLHLSEFDQVRHDTLRTRIDINWRRFNDIDVERATAAGDEKSRLGIQRDRIQLELCADFRELVSIYERLLGQSLPDHYTLFDICPQQ